MPIRALYIPTLLVLLTIAGNAQDNFSIDGSIGRSWSGRKIHLLYQTADSTIQDSVVVHDGNFAFSGRVRYPQKARLFIIADGKSVGEAQDVLNLYLAPDNIRVASSDSLKNARITGSVINDEVAELRASRLKNDTDIKALEIEFSQLSAAQQSDPAVRDKFVQREQHLLLERFRVNLDFAVRHPQSYLSVECLAAVASQPELADQVSRAYLALDERLKNTPLAQQIPILLASVSDVKVNSIAPDFQQPDLAGKMISLSDYKGKYVLIDFWASWCGPCRAENPNLVSAYQRFSAKGFEILGVSIDKKSQREAWAKAIQKDKLVWRQVSDLKGVENAAARRYGVIAIPMNFLVDPSGRIIARDIRGETLQRTLSTLLE